MMTRREALTTTVAATAAVAGLAALPAAAQAPAPAGPHSLPALPYALDALEPHIDAATMGIHHGKHHATYITNLNKALADQPALAKKSAEDLVRELNSLPEAVRTAVRNNGGGHYNHSLFWQMMRKGGGSPKGALAAAIDRKFGSLDGFKTQLTDAAMKTFGSGWAWLSLDAGKQLVIQSTPNQDSPLTGGNIPLLGVDVWEHAYYLKYQNKRADYVAAFFNVVNWDFVAARFAKHAK